MGGDALNGINNMDYTGGFTNHGAGIDACQTTFFGAAGVTPFILIITDGLATSANGNLDKWGGPPHGRASAVIAKASGTQIETVFINPATQTPTLVSYMNDLSTSVTHHLAGDFDQLGTTVSNIAYDIA